MRKIFILLNLIVISLTLACFSDQKIATNSSNLVNQTPTSTNTVMKSNSNVSGNQQIPPSPDTLTIGLTLLRKGQESAALEVKNFVKGDGVRLNVSVVESGYLYILYKGSDGDTQVLFPNKEYFDSKNEIEPHKTLVIPNKGWFFFDEKKGTETIYVIYSRQPNAQISNGNAWDNWNLIENWRSQNNNSDSFITKDGNLIKVVKLNHQ